LGLDKWNREEDPDHDPTEKTFEGVCHVITRFKTGALEQAIFTSRHARVCTTDTISLNPFVIADAWGIPRDQQRDWQIQLFGPDFHSHLSDYMSYETLHTKDDQLELPFDAELPDQPSVC
jgi:hypothetical protein